jgi:hypothetical protein
MVLNNPETAVALSHYNLRKENQALALTMADLPPTLNGGLDGKWCRLS